MIEPEKILTLHPDGKKGVNISREKYNTIRTFILDLVKKHGEITYQDISDMAEDQLTPTFEGKVIWYVVTVKLDLEARGIIERIPKTSPHKVRLTLSR